MTMDFEREYQEARALVERELSGCFLTDGPDRELLDAMSPLKVLGRGYAIARMGEDVVSSVAAVRVRERLDVLVSDGVLRCEVKEKEERSWQ